MGINWTEDMECGHVLAASLDKEGHTVPCLWCADIAVEREACAKVAAGVHDHADCDHGEGYMDGRRDAAAAIRARS